MGRYIDYEPLHIDEIDRNTCKWLVNEVCVNDKCRFLADYPPKEKCSKNSKCRCENFEKENRKNIEV